jgi:hypothetical protein
MVEDDLLHEDHGVRIRLRDYPSDLGKLRGCNIFCEGNIHVTVMFLVNTHEMYGVKALVNQRFIGHLEVVDVEEAKEVTVDMYPYRWKQGIPEHMAKPWLVKFRALA